MPFTKLGFLVNLIPPLAYHICLSLPASVTQPGALLLAKSFPIGKNALPAVTDARGQSRLLLMREFVAVIIDLFNIARKIPLFSRQSHIASAVFIAVWFGCVVVVVKTNDL